MRRLRRSDDSGFTMLVVVVSALLVMAMVLVGLGYVVATHRSTRTAQDSKGATAAAQAGLQDYIERLNTCEDYYAWPNQACTGATANPGLRLVATATNHAVVPGTAGGLLSVYSQRVVLSPTSASNISGVLRVEVIGQVLDTATTDVRRRVRETRTLVAELRRDGFLGYLYFSDFETFSPAAFRPRKPSVTYTGSTPVSFTSTDGTTHWLQAWQQYTVVQPTLDQLSRGCNRYYYTTAVAGRTTFPRTLTGPGLPAAGAEYWPGAGGAVTGDTTAYQCLTISFAANDVFNGKVHSNDAMSISGPVLFKDKVTTGWQPTSGNPWYGTGTPSTAGYKPQSVGFRQLPSTTDKQADAARANGCLYTGPTSLRFLPGGGYAVRSPLTRGNSVNPGCATVSGSTLMTAEQTVAGPANGVVYVQKTTGSGSCLTFQSTSGDATNYDNAGCTRGDAFVQGTVKGRFTVAAEHDTLVTGSTVYASGLTGTDALGLVAGNNVAVWHPVTAAGADINAVGDLEINAAIASTGGSFTVLNHDKGAALGKLTVRGALIQRYRGPVATSSGNTVATGYAKDYSWDSRLVNVPPPSFVQPEQNSWDVASVAVKR